MLFYVVFIVFLFYGQRIQMYVMIREVEGSLYKLKHMRDEGRKKAIETIQNERCSCTSVNANYTNMLCNAGYLYKFAMRYLVSR